MFCKICSDILKVTPKVNVLHSFYSSNKRFYQTHYEVLELSQNCTAKDIRSAFIKLSKQHHPDVNKSEQSHGKFLKINEAYKVLGKLESRREYDLGLRITEEFPNARRHNIYYGPGSRNPYHDPLFWSNRDRRQDMHYNNQPYYGIDGIPRLSNAAILWFCFFFAMIGLGLQYVAITKSHTFRRDYLIRKSMETEAQLSKTREAATANGNIVQLEALKTKLLGNVKETDQK